MAPDSPSSTAISPTATSSTGAAPIASWKVATR